MAVEFSQLVNADLVVDEIYKGGSAPNMGAEVLSKLMGCENTSGIRKVMRKDGSKLPAYVVLFTSMDKLEWPDYLDEETGIFRYYGDNRTPGRNILDTSRKGNLLLELVFDMLNRGGEAIKEIPPFFIFKKDNTYTNRDVRFLGLAAPGNPHISPDRDLVAFWRSMDGKRFQNYESYFTVLNTREPIKRQWLNALINDHDNSLQYAPEAWKNFVKSGRNGIEALTAKKMFKIPSPYKQLQTDEEGNRCLSVIRNHYASNPYGFEMCAKEIVEKMDDHFQDFSLTRPWRDGGRDALGYYVMNADSHNNTPLKIDCALEAKCYDKTQGVGVKQMSRLISRIRYRQFGIMLTTSFVSKQAYQEVVEDGHPILIVSASDIAATLRKSSITSTNIDEWLHTIDDSDTRFSASGVTLQK